MADAKAVDSLLSEWFNWKPPSGRLKSISRAIRNQELFIAATRSRVVGFIHYVMHEDVIDGGPNSLISAFFVSRAYRGKRIGTLLLDAAVSDSLKKGAVGVETSTRHARAKKFYEVHHFEHEKGDIREVFLELDIPQYLKARKNPGVPCDERVGAVLHTGSRRKLGRDLR